MTDLEQRIELIETFIAKLSASANKKITQLGAIPEIVDADLVAMVDMTDGTTKKGTSLQIKNYVGRGQESFDATVGLAGSGADYFLVQDAIDAGKFNLLVIGDYINSETVVLGANFVSITIAKKWIMNEGYITIGAGGLKIEGGILNGVYTLTANKMFLGSGTLQMHNVSVFMNNSTIANTGISQLTFGTKHIISNCNFVLSNTGESGFLAPGDGSSFTNLNVIGGGVSCKGFIINAQDTLIDDIHFDADTFENNGTMIKIGVGLDKGEAPKAFPEFSSIDNVMCEVGGSTMVISVTDSFTQVSNITGSIAVEYKASVCKTTNCSCIDLIFSGTTDSNYFVNCSFAGATAISIPNDWNQFVNCTFGAAFTLASGANNNQFVNCTFGATCILASGSNNNQLLLCSSLGGFTNNGTDNAIIEEISDDETLSADSPRLLATQRSIKTYADNISKGTTVEYYFSDTADAVIPLYDLMYRTETGESESTALVAITAPDTLIQTFITTPTQPDFTTLVKSIYDIHIHALGGGAGAKDVYIYAKFYKRTSGGVETLLGTTDNSPYLTISNVGYTIHFSLSEDKILLLTDRLVVKFFGTPVGAGTTPAAQLFMEGSNASRIDIHVTAGGGLLNLQNIIYVNDSGNDLNNGKNMGSPKFTIDSGLTAAAAQSPTSSNIVVVKVLGGVRYAENVTVPSWVVLDMSDAIMLGQVTLGVTMGTDSFYYANNVICPASSQAIRCSGAGNRYIKTLRVSPSLSSTFLSLDSGATAYLDVGDLDGVAGGAKNFNVGAGCTLYAKVGKFRETVPSILTGTYIADIKDDPNGDSTRINNTANQVIRGKDKTTLGTYAVPSVVDIEAIGPKWNTAPHFIAYNPSQIQDVTGDGTVYTIILGNTDRNIGNHYNPVTGIFTVPTGGTGLYFFNIVLPLTDMNAASYSDVNIRVVRTGTAATWYLKQVNPDKIIVGEYLILNGSVELKLDAGDTIKFQVQVVGGTKSVDVEQGTTFSGRLLTKV